MRIAPAREGHLFEDRTTSRASHEDYRCGTVRESHPTSTNKRESDYIDIHLYIASG